MAVKAFLFDLDGVLTDSSIYHFAAWKKAAQRFSMEIDDAFEPMLRGISRKKSAQMIAHRTQTSLSEKEIETLMKEKNQYYLDAITAMSPEDRLPGVNEMFAFAKAHHIKTALVSASLNAEWVIQLLGMADWFDFIVNPAPLNPKPSPDLFLNAAQNIDVAPRFCLGFEDAPAGVKAIKTAQMTAIGIGEDLGADYHFSHLLDAYHMIQQNVQGLMP